MTTIFSAVRKADGEPCEWFIFADHIILLKHISVIMSQMYLIDSHSPRTAQARFLLHCLITNGSVQSVWQNCENFETVQDCLEIPCATEVPPAV